MDWDKKIFLVDLTKEQIKNSPEINTDLPVSRQEEVKLQKYYPWVQYWGSGYYSGSNDVLAISPGPLAMGLPRTNLTEEETVEEQNANKHLRSTDKVIGYKIAATDGEIGDAEDFLIDVDTWKIDLLLIDTGHWFPGKKVLFSVDRIKEIDWETSSIIANTTIAHVKDSPEYDPNQESKEVYTLIPHDG